MESTLAVNKITGKGFIPFDPLLSPLKGRNLIEASAGTGKTFTITRLFIRLLLEQELPVSSILVVTFTEAATLELRERIYLLLKESLKAFNESTSDDPLLQKLLRTILPNKAQSLLNNALNNFDNCAIFTIHGFCQRILSDYTFESDSTFGATLITDQQELIDEAACDFWRIHFYNNSEMFISYAIQSKISPETFIDLFNKSKNYNDLRIIPETAMVDFYAIETSLISLFDQLKLQWKLNRETIIKLLNSKTLKATKYKEQIITRMTESMNLFCGSDKPDPVLFKSFENFTTPVIASNTKKNEQVIADPFFDLCAEFNKKADELCEAYLRYFEHLQKQSLDFISKQVGTNKALQNVLYFDDLLRKVHQTLGSEKNGKILAALLAKKYGAALIDEFQDTDSVQYSIFSRIFSAPDSISFLIGDPKQAIYSFRGADIFTYFDAVQQVTSKFSLTTNYRSDPELVTAVSSLFSHSENPFLFEQIQINELNGDEKKTQHVTIDGVKQEPFKIWFNSKEQSNYAKEQSIPIKIAQKIAQLVYLGYKSVGYVGSQPITASHIAILVRTNSEAFLYQSALSQLAIPSVVDSSRSVFTTIEAQEMYYLLCAIAEPTDNRLINAALTLPFFGLNSRDIERCLSDEHWYSSFLEIFSSSQNIWFYDGFGSMIRTFFNKVHLQDTILGLPSGERKLTNYLHITELLEHESLKRHQRTSAVISWLADKIRGSSNGISDEEIIRLESDSDTVKILTIHKSKGLEFDIVFCPSIAITGSEQRQTSAYIIHGQDNKPALVIGQEEKKELKCVLDRETLAENLRLLYVALTRAKSQCFLIYDNSDPAATSALSYLLFGNDQSPFNVSLLKDKVKSLSENEIWRGLKGISELYPSISAEFFPEIPAQLNETRLEKPGQLSSKSLTCVLPQPWKIASYSSLTHSHITSETKLDEFIPEEKMIINSSYAVHAEQLNIFTFPKGAKAGTFLHDLLEQIDLSNIPDDILLQQITNSQLVLSGFDSCWAPVIIDLMKNIAAVQLSAEDTHFSLSDIGLQNCIKEMEFHFPLKTITPSDMTSAFAAQMNLFSDNYSAEGLQFSPVGGFMKGFIDMVFVLDNRYYILDWKSNHLGSDLNDYSEEQLLTAMKSEHYVLQYHIYCLALDQYLKLHLPGYNYKNNFGGVFYIFLRGISINSNTGIFFNKPDAAIIENLGRRMIVA